MIDIFHDFYRGKRVLVTGHTGYKGSWLSIWLHELGEMCIRDRSLSVHLDAMPCPVAAKSVC